MRYFLELSFDGTPFHGWQIQPNARSVQETIETALSRLLAYPTQITGAGRTDTGVHAQQMFAHFDVETPLPDISKFLVSLNSIVGKDIYIKNVIKVPEDVHARFDASERTYKYFISTSKNPFLKDLYWKSPTSLDFDKMNQAASMLLGVSDFTSFAKLHSDSKTNICDVRKAIWHPINKDVEAFNFLGNLNDGAVFTISADRFLRNMVRAIVGTLIEVGRGKLSIDGFENVIKEKNRDRKSVV